MSPCPFFIKSSSPQLSPLTSLTRTHFSKTIHNATSVPLPRPNPTNRYCVDCERVSDQALPGLHPSNRLVATPVICDWLAKLRPGTLVERWVWIERSGCALGFLAAPQSPTSPARTYRGQKGLLLNVVQRCGPIVEVIDGRIYFVHFSAKEYLFSSESDRYLKVPESNYAIAETCLKYLSTDCFDSGLSDEAISEGMIRGVYFMQDYAASYWLEHILRGSTDRKTSSCPECLFHHVKEMIELRENSIYEGSYTGRAPVNGLKSFEQDEPEIFEKLMHVHSFLQRRWMEFSLADGESWVNEDPLTISATQLRVHELLEAALCPSSDHPEREQFE